MAGRKAALAFDGCERGAKSQSEDTRCQRVVGRQGAIVCGRIAASAAPYGMAAQ
ncbi:hypothetical protein [Streptomyces sp. NPDC002516]